MSYPSCGSVSHIPTYTIVCLHYSLLRVLRIQGELPIHIKKAYKKYPPREGLLDE
jgi:hypothetical protein